MLIRYKETFEKIAMGLLSFMPEEKEVKKLQETINAYKENDDWHLYLWREKEDLVGAIGIRIVEDKEIVVQHITVNPSHRNLGIGQKIVNALSKLYGENYTIIADNLTEGFIQKYNDEGKKL